MVPADDALNYKADNLCEVSRVPLEVEPPLTEDMDLEEMSQIISPIFATLSQVRMGF